jgi:hypothetical protein
VALAVGVDVAVAVAVGVAVGVGVGLGVHWLAERSVNVLLPKFPTAQASLPLPATP